MKSISCILCLLFTFAIGIVAAPAQEYPNRAIELVVAVPPGSSTDALARVLAERLSSQVKQPVLVVNKVGASGIIGASHVSNAPADGYTLLLGSPSLLTFNPAVFKTLPYDPEKSFSAITTIAEQPLLLVTRNELPVKSLSDLIAMAKDKAGQITYGNAGSTAQLIIEHFSSVTGVKFRSIPYRGSADATVALVSGQIDLLIDPVQSMYPHVQAGSVRALAVTSKSRSPAAPEVPSMAEQGYPNFDITLWYGLVAPAGTPAPVVERLHKEFSTILNASDIKDKLVGQGFQPVLSTGEDMAKRVKSDVELWKRVAAENGIVAQ